MAAYGWTLQQVLDLTLPQMRVLYGAVSRTPPASVLLPALLQGLKGEAKSTAPLEAGGIAVETGAKAVARLKQLWGEADG